MAKHSGFVRISSKSKAAGTATDTAWLWEEGEHHYCLPRNSLSLGRRWNKCLLANSRVVVVYACRGSEASGVEFASAHLGLAVG